MVFGELRGDEDGGDLLKFSESFPAEYWVRGEEMGRVGDKNVATGDFLVREHFLPQPLGAAAAAERWL